MNVLGLWHKILCRKCVTRNDCHSSNGESIKIKVVEEPKFFAGKGLEYAVKFFFYRVLSSAGRASPLQGECRGFEPLSTHQLFDYWSGSSVG